MTVGENLKNDFYWKPLTPETWPDFERLFGPRGACGGCWCMLWRLKNREYEASKGEGTRDAMKTLVDSGTSPGIIAYQDGAPVGWASLGPRADFVRLETSRIFSPIDDKPVWSLTCLVIDKKFRRQGFSAKVIRAAVEFAKSSGADILEAYPIIPKNDKVPDVFAWNGFYSTFLAAGFKEAARRSDTHPVVRLDL